MQKIKQMIIKTDAFQYITARLHQRKRRKELESMYQAGIEKYRSYQPPKPSGEPSDYVWL